MRFISPLTRFSNHFLSLIACFSAVLTGFAQAGNSPSIFPYAPGIFSPSQGQEGYLKASNLGEDDIFGFSVAVSGNIAVVGARFESSDGSSEDDDSAPAAGAAYVFVRTNGTWEQRAYLKASNSEEGDLFGSSVAIYGTTIVIGAPGEDGDGTGEGNDSFEGAGAVYVFESNGGGWSQQAYLKASNAGEYDEFGVSVSVSGGSIIVGAPSEGGAGGDEQNNDLEEAGAAYVFVRDGFDWVQQAYLKANNAGDDDLFGDSVSINGDSVVIGASGEGSDGSSPADNSIAEAGAAYVFLRTGTSWNQDGYLKPRVIDGDDGFGWSVAISGDLVVVGAPGEDGSGNSPRDNRKRGSGAAYVFERGVDGWSQQDYLKARETDVEDRFGTSVTISGEVIAVGAPGESGVGNSEPDNSSLASGAAYVFQRSGTSWSQRRYLKSEYSAPFDAFGTSVSLSDDTLLVGAPFESGDGSSEADDSIFGTGAAFPFLLETETTLNLLVSFPENEMEDVGLLDPITLTFDLPVERGSGCVNLRRVSDHRLVQSLDVDSATFSGSVFEIFPSESMPPNTELYVEVPVGAIWGQGGEFYYQSDPASLSFTTVEGNVYVDAAADFTITADNGSVGVLDDGDVVRWREGSPLEVSGLLFGSDAFSSIADGLEGCFEGGTVFVAEGVYAEGSPWVLDKSVSIIGEGAKTTNLLGEDSHRIFEIPTGELEISLEGLNLSGGVAPDGESGGAILNEMPGRLAVIDCWFDDNEALKGGAIAQSEEGHLWIVGTLFTANSAQSGGGAEACGGALHGGGEIQVSNSTFSGNSAGDGLGGAICGDFEILSLSNCTLTANEAGDGGAIYNQGETGEVEIGNSIVAGNTASLVDADEDLNAAFRSLGGNFIGVPSDDALLGAHDQTFATSAAAVIGDVIEPVLADNGGDTLSHALVADSVALDGGLNLNAPLEDEFDQRGGGFLRLDGATVDIGAIEQAVARPVITLLGDDPLFVECLEEVFADPGATAAGTGGEDLSSSIVVRGGPVLANALGSTTITYDVTDATGLSATQVTREVIVRDSTAPQITLQGEGSLVVLEGDTYADPGATVVDACDSTVLIQSFNPVNTDEPGIYTVRYNAVDDSGNLAEEVTRTVEVLDKPRFGIVATDAAKDEGDRWTTDYTFTVTRSGTTLFESVVPWSIRMEGLLDEADFESISGTVVFAPGSTSETLVIRGNGDEVVEADEIFTVQIGAEIKDKNLSVVTARGVILNDDESILEVNDVTELEGDDGETPFIFTVTLSQPVDEEVSILYGNLFREAGPDDYDSLVGFGWLFFEPGELRKTFEIIVLGDEVVEADERFGVVLAVGDEGIRNIAYGKGEGVGTILNDDSASFSIDDVVVGEGDSGGASALFSVRLDADVQVGFDLAHPPFSVTVGTISGGTADSEDYTVGSEVLIFDGLAGEVVTFAVPVHGDTKVELDETILVALEENSFGDLDVTIADASGVATIVRQSRSLTLFRWKEMMGHQTSSLLRLSTKPFRMGLQ